MAHPGDLDTSFGSGGRKTVNFGGIDAARAVLVQPNGRVLAAGGGGPTSSFCVVRLRSANGTLDPTFGSAGKRLVDFGTDDESVHGAALQADGKIVLAGDSRLQPAVVRLKANGALDTTFDGDGKKLFSWGAIGRVTAVVVAPNGKILLGGFSGPEGGNIQIARMKANGALDTTFGTGGIATVDFGGTEFGEAMARQADGRILVAGRSSAGGPVVARLRATGVLDPDFGGDGRVTLPGGGSLSAVLVQPDRNIVVAGNANGSATMTVTRLKPDGSLDATFGTGGTTTVAFGSLANPLGGAARQPNGKIVIAG
ncbi:MAG TPA: delta-60 repeat domain-containing protein, partial [Solirubrobacteraceae bacterium]|nr:delta-60 repeat domain-containing protein [Solirubrobacteraceae bacterium]